MKTTNKIISLIIAGTIGVIGITGGSVVKLDDTYLTARQYDTLKMEFKQDWEDNKIDKIQLF